MVGSDIYFNMRYIITESQYKIIIENSEVRPFPGIEFWAGDWSRFNSWWEKRGYPNLKYNDIILNKDNYVDFQKIYMTELINERIGNHELIFTEEVPNGYQPALKDESEYAELIEKLYVNYCEVSVYTRKSPKDEHLSSSKGYTINYWELPLDILMEIWQLIKDYTPED